MSAPVPTTWTCSVCGRRVPKRVAECFCGAKQAEVERHQQQEVARQSHRIPREVALILALLVVGGVYLVHSFVTERESENAGAPDSERSIFRAALPSPEVLATPPPVGASAAPAPLPATPPMITQARPVPAPVLGLTPEPVATVAARAVATSAPAPDPTPDEREVLRAQGLQAYSEQLSRLVSLAAQLRERIGAYRVGCFGQHAGGGYTNCADIEADIGKTAQAIERGLDDAEDQGRRAWLEPGVLRRVKSESYFGTRDWEELQRAARHPRPE